MSAVKELLREDQSPLARSTNVLVSLQFRHTFIKQLDAYATMSPFMIFLNISLHSHLFLFLLFDCRNNFFVIVSYLRTPCDFPFYDVHS